jgi:hypothetical protein
MTGTMPQPPQTPGRGPCAGRDAGRVPQQPRPAAYPQHPQARSVPRDLWAFRDDAGRRQDSDLADYLVLADDGRLGTVVETVDVVGASRLNVFAGPWLFGHELTVPAGAVRAIDDGRREVHLNVPRTVVRAAPRYDPSAHSSFEQYRQRLGEYYASADLSGRLTP